MVKEVRGPKRFYLDMDNASLVYPKQIAYIHLVHQLIYQTVYVPTLDNIFVFI